MVLGQDKRAVGTFSSRQEAEQALNALNNSGFPMDKVSVIAKDADRNDQIAGADVSNRAGGNEAREGAGAGAVAGTVLGGVGGLLVGLGTLAIPGVGPFLAAGTVATTFAGAGVGAAAGGLVGALAGLGIPEERAQVYSNLVSQGDYLVIVDGPEEEIRRAESILSHGGIREWGVYNSPLQSGSAPAQNYTTDVAPSVTQPSDRYLERTATNQDAPEVEIIDRRNQGR
jgi:hypothetical protein